MRVVKLHQAPRLDRESRAKRRGGWRLDYMMRRIRILTICIGFSIELYAAFAVAICLCRGA